MEQDNNALLDRTSHPLDKENIDTELIGIVYEAAFDQKFWPDLLEGIAHAFELHRARQQSSSPSAGTDPQAAHSLFAAVDQHESHFLAVLLPHLYRSLKLKREYNEANHIRGQAQAILDHFPVGVLVVNAEARLLSANQCGLDAITAGGPIFLRNGVLCTVQPEKDRQLKKQIYIAANAPLIESEEHISSLSLAEDEQDAATSLLISPDPYPSNHYDRQVEPCAAVFITSSLLQQKIAEPALQLLFNLSPAEARLAALLTSGISLTEVAQQSHIAKNTAKVQLKSIFSKMRVTRQAELIQRILTSPAVFNPANTGHDNTLLKDATHLNMQAKREADITLRDGRRLHYAEYGAANGKPIFHLHGILGCRYERYPDDAIIRDLGVRLIVPDRPGFGLSEHNLQHGYLDFVDDLVELADHLDIPTFSLMGLSIGAVYACAAAYKIPQRLHRVAMISSTPPFRSFADLEGVPPSLKLLMAFSKYLPTAAQLTAQIAIKNACKDPNKFFANIPLSHSDRELFARTWLASHIEHCLLAGSRQCHSGFVRDILLAAEGWPFSLQELSKTIAFWHGTQDTHSPLNRIAPVIEAVPNSCMHTIEGGGHFLIYGHWRQIITSLIE